MNKRGQITIFVIVGVLIVSLVFGFFFFSKEVSNDLNSVEAEEVYAFIQNCVEESAKYALVDFGDNGGSYSYVDSIYSFPYSVPVLVDGEKELPSIEDFENDLGLYMSENIYLCLEEMDFSNEGILVSVDDVSAKTSIGNNVILFDVSVPTTVSIEGLEGSTTFEEFSTSVEPIYIPKILDFLYWVVSQRELYPSSICLTCLSNKMDETGFHIEMYESGVENEFVYVVTDSKSNFFDEPYNFSFGIRYDSFVCEDLEDCINQI